MLYQIHKYKICKDFPDFRQCKSCRDGSDTIHCIIERELDYIMYGLKSIKEGILDFIDTEDFHPYNDYKQQIISQFLPEHQELYEKLSLLK